MVISMWARIDGDRVAEITDQDPQGRFHPSIEWVSCDVSVGVDYRYADGEFFPPLPPSPDPAPLGPPQVVTRAQGKAALITAGLWDSVLAYVDAIEDTTQQALARVALDDTTEWRRDSPFLTTAAAALGLSDEDLDELFVAAFEIVL